MSADGKSVLCANYASGDVTVFPTADDGSLLDGVTTPLPKDRQGSFPGPCEARQDVPHSHCYSPLGDSGFGVVCDLGADHLLILRISDGAEVSRCCFAPGSGPRHAAVSADARWVYVSTELGNTIVAIPADPTTGKVGNPTASLALVPKGTVTTASHIELSVCGRFAYVGNRMGVDSDGACANCTEGAISVIALAPQSPDKHLTLVELKSLPGKVPRSFCVAGNWLVVGEQESSSVRSFGIDGTGRLTEADTVSIPSPGFVMRTRPKQRKPQWSKINDINPESRRVNLFAKVMSSARTEDSEELTDVTVGDATGEVMLQATALQAAGCRPESVVRIQNAKVIMSKGYIRIVVDKWGVLKPAANQDDIEVKSGNNISTVEYELTED